MCGLKLQAIKQGGYYVERDYIVCCNENEEETICPEQYEYKRKKIICQIMCSFIQIFR